MTTPTLRTLHAIMVLAPGLLIPLPPLSAQDLGRPMVTWPRELSRIGGVAELPDGRIIVVDNLEEEVFLGDADGGELRRLGSTGDGPNEYRRPWSVIRGPGDTLWVHAQGRLLRVAPTGTLAGTVTFAPAGGIAPPRGFDRSGRIYWDRVVIHDPRTGELKRQQQYEIVRMRPGGTRVEVVAMASDHAPEMHDQRFHPFARRDAWAVDPDGSVRIVRAADYHVDLVRDGRIVMSAVPLSFAPIPVNDLDRRAYRRDRAANPSGVSFGGRAVAATAEPTATQLLAMERAYPDEIFPRYKPPFVEGGVLRSPAGQLWVVRSPEGPVMAGSHIDVLDGGGRRIRELTLPVGRHLVALDRRGIYLAAEDADGLQTLERYAWPTGVQ